jgi:hypothetical protein
LEAIASDGVLTVPDELLRPFESVRESLCDWGTRERFQCLSSSIKATLDEIKAIVDGIHCPPGPTNAMRDRTHCPPGESNAIRDRTHCPPGATNAIRDRTHYPPGEMKAIRDRIHCLPSEMKVMRDGIHCLQDEMKRCAMGALAQRLRHRATA